MGPIKAINDLKKHGVRFSDAEAALFYPNAMSREDEDAEDEQRFVSKGNKSL